MCKSGSIKETVLDRHLVTIRTINRKFIWPIDSCHFQWPWTTLKVIRLLQDLWTAIRLTCVRRFARFQLTRRIARSLGDSWASCPSKRLNGSNCFFGIQASFHLSYILCYEEIRVTLNKGRPTFLWNFVPKSGLRKFRHGKSIILSTKFVDGRDCWQHDGRRVVVGFSHIVYYMSVDCNALTHVRFW